MCHSRQGIMQACHTREASRHHGEQARPQQLVKCSCLSMLFELRLRPRQLAAASTRACCPPRSSAGCCQHKSMLPSNGHLQTMQVVSTAKVALQVTDPCIWHAACVKPSNNSPVSGTGPLQAEFDSTFNACGSADLEGLKLPKALGAQGLGFRLAASQGVIAAHAQQPAGVHAPGVDLARLGRPGAAGVDACSPVDQRVFF